MMLQALIEYAEREKLGDADFEKVGVRWLIPLDAQGRLLAGPVPLSEDPAAKKPVPKQMDRPFTSPNELNQGTKSHFLCDSLERALLFLDAGAPDKAAGRRVQHAYFQSLLEAAALACPEEASHLQVVLAFLRNEEALASLHSQLTAAKAKTTDNATFEVDGRGLLASESLRRFWRERRRVATNAGSARTARMCIATGALGTTLDTTEKVRGVPGGLATGTNLISFDKESFCSFGLEQAQNAALSAPAELKIRSAMNTLIAKSRGQSLVFNDTVFIHWSRQPMEDDLLDLLNVRDPEAIKQLLHSPRTGVAQHGFQEDAFYAAGLSGNGARIVVRDWIETTVPAVEANLRAWFKNLAIISPDGTGVKTDFKFGALLYGMVREKLDELPPQLPALLFQGALHGGRLPLTALAAALRRQQLDKNKLNSWRLALIKACLIRSPNRKETDTMTEALDPTSKDRAYLCGQLFAVVGRLQLLALGKVGASIAERTYGGVATRPATTFGPLFTKLPAYLKKANTRFPGSGTNKQKEIETLCSRLDATGGLPRILDLEEQGRFALGYYCQLAQYRTDRAAEAEAKQAEEIADEHD